ncbi:pseudouridine synthase [Cucurbitaria berberidis CBS 394.84]|uniref:tRNA pseudouridine(55) synthase n=1 Tax=Cucurbitaria berberidis CBS 394.84 TaxID=1168544 RepID=A0A9P4GJR9_9PLEO|nr:pseudouridine synthase [Cucurbitaria berberidis CBS 394.84]KAF1846855.1 pseudouridine synthase [Cucurbitaria berberidis CBS 394.84]
MLLSNSKPKHINNLKVKLGHGGTLDPMATGVLIVGVGKGTKHLGTFLECTKSYECVVLFGAATDSYDAVGKVVSKAPYEHVTRELVEERLAQFRGKIMQKPSVFSALKVDGKKMYEYAREGKNIPEVAARPVEVQELELVEWLEPGSHEFAWPKEELDGTEMAGAEKLLGIRKEDVDVHMETAARKTRKRSRTPEDDHVEGAGEQPKRPRTETEPAMSGALPSKDTPTDSAEVAVGEQPAENTTTGLETKPTPSTEDRPTETVEEVAPIAATETAADVSNPDQTNDASSTSTTTPIPQPPAVRLRMTVTSGFYVRSLCHDLGLACSSLGLMSSLIRSRQGDYSLNPTSTQSNVLEWSDLEAGPETWEPVVKRQLERFMEKEGWEAEELEDDETFQAKRKEGDRDRSYKGGGKGKGRWNGNGGRNYYDKKMNGGRDGERRDRRGD